MASSTTAWLITGVSSGLGLALALTALKAGHDVIGTTRDISKAASRAPEFAELGGRWLEADVSLPASQQIIEAAIKEYEEQHAGSEPIKWTIINNAGYFLAGVVEDMSEEQIARYLQTVLFGVIRVLKATIPTLRRNKTGILALVSSGYAFSPVTPVQVYGAAKASAESLYESYAPLLAPFGIKTVILAAGGMARTDIAKETVLCDLGISPDYEAAMAGFLGFVEAWKQNSTIVRGDPTKFAQRALQVFQGEGLGQEILDSGRDQGQSGVTRVLFGKDLYWLYGEKLKVLNSTHVAMEQIASSVEIDE